MQSAEERNICLQTASYPLHIHLYSTATELNGLPAWFLRLQAPAFHKPMTRLCNISILTSTVPKQWKQAIHKCSTNPAPKQLVDFRPISITPVLISIMEKAIASCTLPLTGILNPLIFSNQFTFRKTRSINAVSSPSVIPSPPCLPYIYTICFNFKS